MQPSRLEHSVLRKQAGTYAAFPVIELLADGRLAVAYLSNDANIRDHYGFGDWTVVTSADGGVTFAPAAPDDMSIPFNWPGTSPRERYDRFAGEMPDGTLVTAGGVGFEEAPADRVEEARAAGRLVSTHPLRDDSTVLLGGNRVFVQRSHDGGRTWERQEWEVPGAHRLNGFPRCTVLADGTVLAPLYDGGDVEADRVRVLVHRSEDNGARWQLRLVGSGASGGYGDESALVETEPGHVLCLIRQAPQRLSEAWSDDGGRTWSEAIYTDIWGYPPHLLKLRDGRILCSYGHRREPLGVQAVISADGGRSWDLEHRAILRGDGETVDLGYPISVQLPDDSIFTVYYMTIGGMTHVAATRWELPWE